MLQYFKRKRGQSALELAIMFVIVIAVLLTMAPFMKRSLAGKMKSTAQEISDTQYSVDNQNEVTSTSRLSNTEETFQNGQSVSNLLAPEQTNTATNSVILNTQQEDYGGNGT